MDSEFLTVGEAMGVAQHHDAVSGTEKTRSCWSIMHNGYPLVSTAAVVSVPIDLIVLDTKFYQNIRP